MLHLHTDRFVPFAFSTAIKFPETETNCPPSHRMPQKSIQPSSVPRVNLTHCDKHKITHMHGRRVQLYIWTNKNFILVLFLLSTKELAGFMRIYLLLFFFFLLYWFLRSCVNLTRRDKLHRKVGEIRDGRGFCTDFKTKTSRIRKVEVEFHVDEIHSVLRGVNVAGRDFF